MKKRLLVGGLSLIGLGLVPVMAISVASAATPSTTTTAPKTKIAASAFRDEKLQAKATVLNSTTTAVQAAEKAKTMPQLLSTAGLSKQQFHQKVKAQLEADLQAKGYTSSEIKTAIHNHKQHHKNSKA